MFWKTLRMELSRAVNPRKVWNTCLVMALIFFFSNLEMLHDIFVEHDLSGYASIQQIYGLFAMDTYKCVLVVLLAGLHASSFCKDENNKYLRMILARTDVTTYTQCRFIANLCVTVLTAVGSLYLYAAIMRLFGVPLMTENGADSFFYKEIANAYPLVYIAMNGIVFGTAAAACSSIGILYSAYKANSFVCIGMSGLMFYIALSYIPYGPFHLLTIVAMGNVLAADAPKFFMFLWSLVYMLFVIGFSGLLFWRKMRWRVEHGYM